MVLFKKYFVCKSDICIFCYNGKLLFRCFGYLKKGGYKILGGFFFKEVFYYNIVKCVCILVKFGIILLFFLRK